LREDINILPSEEALKKDSNETKNFRKKKSGSVDADSGVKFSPSNKNLIYKEHRKSFNERKEFDTGSDRAVFRG